MSETTQRYSIFCKEVTLGEDPDADDQIKLSANTNPATGKVEFKVKKKTRTTESGTETETETDLFQINEEGGIDKINLPVHTDLPTDFTEYSLNDIIVSDNIIYQVREDTSNPPDKLWEAIGGGQTLTAGTGLSIDPQNEISIDANAVVQTTGEQTIDGSKTFNSLTKIYGGATTSQTDGLLIGTETEKLQHERDGDLLTVYRDNTAPVRINIRNYSTGSAVLKLTTTDSTWSIANVASELRIYNGSEIIAEFTAANNFEITNGFKVKTLTTANGFVRTDVDGNFSTAVLTASDLSGIIGDGLYYDSTNGGSITINSDYTATKSYVDSVVQGLDVKDSVRVATTGNISDLNSVSPNIDNIDLADGDRVLVKDQDARVDNGIYIYDISNFTLSRAPDFPAGAEVNGAFTFVEEGDTNANLGFVQKSASVTIGTDNITFTQFSGAGQIDAGNGISKVGNTLSINPTVVPTLENNKLQPSQIPFATTSSVGGFKVGENLEMNDGVLSASAGIKTVPDSSGTSSLSTSIFYPNVVDQTQAATSENSGTEGEIIYNESNNKFYEASGDSTVAFRPLGYSFFSENMEGQAPIQDKAFFFFELTPFSIKLSWTNPTQYPSGITASTSQSLDENSPIVTAPANGVGGLIYFPVVNRIMVQIKKINNDPTHTYTVTDYITITDKTSPISSTISGLEYGRVICSKDFPIPPLNSTLTDPSGLPTFDGGRTSSVYALEHFATSMILHLDNNNKLSTILATADSQSFIPNVTLPNHPDGYEIKFWYENQYDSGSMSEADFNVQTFTTTENGTDLIKFVQLEPPSVPGQPTFSLATRLIEDTDKTFVSLDVLDPQFVAGSDITYNTDINFSAIKFEYANYNDGETLVWQDLNHIYIFSEALEAPVRENITNGQYTPPDGLTHQAGSRNFLFDLIEILNATPTAKVNHKFRVSYKNSNNVNFSDLIESNVITIDNPDSPSVQSVKMYDYNKLEIVIPPYTNNNAIIGDSTSELINNEFGEDSAAAVIQLEKLEFQITKKEDSDTTGVILNSFDVYYLDDSEPSNHQLILIQKDIDTNYYSINQNQNTGNLENLKFYVEIDHNDISNTILTVNYEIQVKVRNTINSNFTDFSTPASTFTLTKPDTNILTTDPVIFSLSSTKNNTLDIKLGSTDPFTDNLVAGSRGVTTAYLSSNMNLIPTIKEFLWQSDNLKYVDSTFTLTDLGVNNSSASVETDASGYLGSKANFYDALKYDGTTTKTADLNISIKYKNFYINAYNDNPITSAYRLRATAPSIINPVAANKSDPNFQNSIKNTLNTLNTAEIKWNAINIDSGRNFGLALVDESGIVFTELTNTITNYKLKVEINSSTNSYLNQKYPSSSWPTAYEEDYSNNDNTLHKTSTEDANIPTSVELNSGLSSDLLLWPETTYKVTIDTTNSLGYTSTHDTNVSATYLSFTTPSPVIPDGLHYFDESYGLEQLHSTSVTTDLQDSTVTYANKGILMEAISNTTVYNNSELIQISNGNIPSQIISQNVSHIINKVNVQTILTDTQVYSWSSASGVVAAEETITKFAINRIENSGSTEIYSLEGGLVTSTNHSALFTINRTGRQDAYKFSQDYDQKNYGYWYMENIGYTINTVPIPSEDYGKPLKYELANYYSDNGNNINTASSSSTTILKNSANSNEYIYFDQLNQAPTIGGTPDTELSINYNQSATINGIPNLALFDTNNDTFDVSYLAQNYSTRFLLDSSINIAEHYFTYSSELLRPISWSNHTTSAPNLTTDNYERNSDHWKLANLALTPPTAISTPRYDVELNINLSSTHSTVTGISPYTQRFIYDKDAKDMIDEIKSSMYYDTNFAGEFNDSFAKVQYNPTSSIDTGETNDNQLNVYGVSFHSNSSWQTQTGIYSTNVVNYPNLSQTHPVFTTDENYKTVIFKYTKALSAASNFIKVICAFGDESNIDITDFDEENIRVYLHQGKFGANHSDHYWLKLSTTNSSITSNIATNQQITYVGELAYSKMGGSSQMTSDEFTSGNGIADGTFVNADATGWKDGDGIVPKKMLGAFVNKISYSSIETLDFYLAIQLKNNVTKGIIKPDLYILNNKVSVLQLD